MTITVLAKTVGELARLVEIDNQDLSAFQSLVGGDLESFPIGNGVVMLLNEEGKFNGSAPHLALAAPNGTIVDIVMGDVIFTSSDSEGDFATMTDEQLTHAKMFAWSSVVS